MTRLVHQAIFQFHKHGESTRAAQDYLVDGFHRRFKTESRLPSLELQLEEYMDAYRALGARAFQTQKRVAYSVGYGVQITGEVARMDLARQRGYDAWLFSSDFPHNWRQELRLPVLQQAIAESMGVKANRVAIGYYILGSGEHISTQFSDDEVNTAIAELASVSRGIESIQRGQASE